ncbi:hypothetical protein GCM10010193_26130 [Kitasatospora atroaurantiaca]
MFAPDFLAEPLPQADSIGAIAAAPATVAAVVRKLLRFNPDLMVAWPLSSKRARTVEALACFGETNDALPVGQGDEQMKGRLCLGS